MAYQFTQTGAELQDLIDRIYQIAEEYDPGTSYVIGDYCSSGGKVYRCTAATTGAFEPSKWTDSVIVMDAIKSLKGRMTTAEGDIDAAQSDISSLNQSLAQKVQVEVFTVSGQTVAANTHTNLTVSHTWAGTPLCIVVTATPNAAFVFCNVVSWTSTGCTVGCYNSATVSVTGYLTLVNIYRA